ncbi:hypothetical protein M3J09_004687 [Ascochyta lentis]
MGSSGMNNNFLATQCYLFLAILCHHDLNWLLSESRKCILYCAF